MDETETAAATETAETPQYEDASAETDAAAADVIAQIAEEWASDPADTADDGEATEGSSGEDGADPEGDDTADAESTAEEPAAEERGIERLVAREVEVRAKEEALKAREARLSEVEAENATLRQQLSALPQDFIGDLGYQPYEAIQAAGHDPDHVIRLMLAKKFEKDGKPVPAELRNALDKANSSLETRRLRDEIREFKQQQAVAAFVAQVEAGARDYVSKGLSKDVPLVAKAAKANPDRVHREILDEIARDAQGRAGKDPNAALLTYEAAAARVEKRWAEMTSLFGESPAASTTAPETKSTQGAQKPQTPSTTKTKAAVAPTKPLMKSPPKTQEELEKQAIDEAMQEYRRLESAKKAAVRR
jgi:hypothetical protein